MNDDERCIVRGGEEPPQTYLLYDVADELPFSLLLVAGSLERLVKIATVLLPAHILIHGLLEFQGRASHASQL